jgi:hypothetical protein
LAAGVLAKNEKLIGVHFLLILALVFDQRRMVFSISGVLLFEDGVYPATVFLVAVGMIDLDFTIRFKALRKFREGVSYPYIQIKSINAVAYALTRFRNTDCIAFIIK